MPGFNEAVATLGDWASKLGATHVEPAKDIIGHYLRAVDGEGKGVGILRWRYGTRWHVSVGMGSWSVTPANAWTVEGMNADTETAIRCHSIFPITPLEPTAPKSNPHQTTLALEPSA
jgi:hypothetical protein